MRTLAKSPVAFASETLGEFHRSKISDSEKRPWWIPSFIHLLTTISLFMFIFYCFASDHLATAFRTPACGCWGFCTIQGTHIILWTPWGWLSRRRRPLIKHRPKKMQTHTFSLEVPWRTLNRAAQWWFSVGSWGDLLWTGLVREGLLRRQCELGLEWQSGEWRASLLGQFLILGRTAPKIWTGLCG